MRKIHVSEITRSVKEMFIEANQFLGEDVSQALKDGLAGEESPVGQEVLKQLLKNAEIAKEQEVPICQDTGTSVVFMDIGQDVHFTGGELTEAVNQGVREAYLRAYLRTSMVKDPLNRENTGDNTPAIIHTRIVPGDKVKLDVAPKGGGSENMSTLKMLTPSQGKEGIIDFVVRSVEQAGPNACPPFIIGVGLGGNFEKVAYLSKKALLRPVGSRHPEDQYAQLEEELLEQINNLGIGPQGFGGRTTALDVHIEKYPVHLTSIPVAVNISCHATRHAHREI
ncbi:fumarate hydratase [Natranaerobius thermophilus]|uniref:Fumarase alpha subunit n=1 Tax=Natranaerobius thermophilus (strain ATCC BAA-1301 / DSM 18059 / JW/NM-WN-LF) TaxID=457570 RepID=B2A0T3_NATTJ|nr:fumarate hydratase [Natranaerobius thermophilus]ACB85963.1 fumarase alpha subunit [Natranaerobius thermophilus JW/NM-WN-LF]